MQWLCRSSGNRWRWGPGGAPGNTAPDGTGLSKYDITVVGGGGGQQSKGGSAGTIVDASAYSGCITDGVEGELDQGADGHMGSGCQVVPNGGKKNCGGSSGVANGGGGGGGAGYYGGGSGASKYTYVGSGGGGGASWAHSSVQNVYGEPGSLDSPGGISDSDYESPAGMGGKSGDSDAWPGGDWKPKEGLSGRVVWSFE